MPAFLRYLTCVGVLFLTPFTALADWNIHWKKLADDMEIAQLQISSTPLLSTQVTLIRTQLKRYKLRVIYSKKYGRSRSTVKELALQSNALVAINASFFDEYGKALGVVISNGRMLNRLHRGGSTLTGILAVSNNSVEIIRRDYFNPINVIEAVQAGPLLIEKGRAVKGLRNADELSRRSAVCIDEKNRFLLIFVSSNFVGASFKQLQQIALNNNVQCRTALNLDGGGSAQLYVSKKLPGAARGIREISVPGRDPVPVVLGLFLR
ncbi:MAG: phosphodiester glycosidase family protein [Candidatus Dadabacteria bacterium]|nr:MAG: phosphodiester glycosidase family protein [Candidatus Dadabacteria bacterium]